MIFAVLGTLKYPSPRMVPAIDAIAGETDEPVFIQTGSTLSEYRPVHADSVDYSDRSTYDGKVRECRVFGTHGGTGSQITALGHGTPVVDFPRHCDRGEHADDMILELAEGWSDRANVGVAQTEAERRSDLLGDELNPKVHSRGKAVERRDSRGLAARQ